MIDTTGLTWFLLRSTGVVALLLLTVAVVLGIAGPAIRRPALRLATVAGHSTAAAAGVILLLGHVALAVADSYVDVSAIAVIVPGMSKWQPLWIGVGALSLDLLLVVAISSALRRRAPLLWWRLHVLSYPAWLLAWGHSISVGTDRTAGWMPAISVTSAICVAAACAVRARAQARGLPVGVGTKVKRAVNPIEPQPSEERAAT